MTVSEESRNTGDRNTGYGNTGDWNTGDWNTGDWNTGYLNTGNRNTGYLNTGNGVVTFFDKPCPGLSWKDAEELVPWRDLPVGVEWVPSDKMTDEEKTKYPTHTTNGGYLKERKVSVQEAFPLVWAKESVEWKGRWLALPNFDADKFVALVGVDVRLDKDLYPQPVVAEPVVLDAERTIVLDGVTYRLVKV
jgi:hypothetical protein